MVSNTWAQRATATFTYGPESHCKANGMTRDKLLWHFLLSSSQGSMTPAATKTPAAPKTEPQAPTKIVSQQEETSTLEASFLLTLN